MALESATYLSELVAANPVGGDGKSAGDNHIRMIKAVLQATFPGMGGAAWRYTSKSSGFTMDQTYNMVYVHCTASFTLALDPAATVGNGFLAVLTAASGISDITIDPDSAELINGGASFALKAGEACLLFCTGTAWRALSFNLASAWVANALKPAAKGDLLAGTGANTGQIVSIGSNGQVLLPYTGATPGVFWGSQAPGMFTGRLQASVSGNALTVAIKTAAGNDPSSTEPVLIEMPSTDGSRNVLALTAATSIVVSAGSTLGTTDGTAHRLYVGFADDSGTPRMFIYNPLDRSDGYSLRGVFDGIAYSSTAEGGAGAADSAHVLYSATAFTSKRVRVLGFVESTQTTAGTWAASPSRVHIRTPFDPKTGDIVQDIQGLGTSSSTTAQSATDITAGSLSITPTDSINLINPQFQWWGRGDASANNNSCRVNSRLYDVTGAAQIAFSWAGGGAGTGSNGFAGEWVNFDIMAGPKTGGTTQTYKGQFYGTFYTTITSYVADVKKRIKEIFV